MSSINRINRSAVASIAIALTCGVAFVVSVDAEPVGSAKPGDSAGKHTAEKTPVVGGTASHAGGAKPSGSTGVANGAKPAGDTKSDAASGAKPASNTKDDVTGGAKSAVETDTKSDGVSGASSPANADTKDDVTAGAEEDTKSDAVSDTDIQSNAEKQITPLDPNGSGDDAVEEDPYAAYNKQQMALFQQHEAVQHYNAAKYYMKNWDNELAELELRAAIMYMPELRIAHRDYCIVALCRGKILRAIAEFCMVFGIGEPIALTQEQQAALRTEASQAHYKKGLELATKGNWTESISELMWARTYLPNDPAVHRSLAFAYASKGDFKMAEQYYQSTFSIDPNDAFAHADFAYLLSKKGKTNEAVSEMAKAVKADPDSPALHVDLGWLAESKGDLKTAETEFRAALARAPQYGQLWCHLGQILEKRKKTEDAVSAYKTALEKDSGKNKQATAALARLTPAATSPPVSTPAVPTPNTTPVEQTKPAATAPASAPQVKTTSTTSAGK